MPAFDEAVALATKNSYLSKIGIHFNLVEGYSLTNEIKKCIRFCDISGQFIYKRNTVYFLKFSEISAIRKELKAQIKKIRKSGVLISHLDSHRHVHTELPIFLIIFDILKKNNILKIRIPLNLSQSNSSRLKIAYKKFYIRMLHILGFTTVDYFGYYINNYRDKYINSERKFELMCHPVKSKDKIIDSVFGVDLNFTKKNLILYNDI